MLYHLVLLKLSPGTSEDKIRNFYSGLETLKSIKDVVSVQCGEVGKVCYAGYSDRTKGYTHALLVVLKDVTALEKYDKDLHHNLIKSTVITPLIDKTVENAVLAVDFNGELDRNSFCSLCNVSCYGKLAVGAATVAILGFAFLKLRSRL